MLKSLSSLTRLPIPPISTRCISLSLSLAKLSLVLRIFNDYMWFNSNLGFIFLAVVEFVRAKWAQQNHHRHAQNLFLLREMTFTPEVNLMVIGSYCIIYSLAAVFVSSFLQCLTLLMQFIDDISGVRFSLVSYNILAQVWKI